ncbi:acetyltransferase [Vibrio alfacsensis]|uniref:acetyltransferase n=1 Tax=Vibrio TaxID=662 RepID=UPI004069526B
MSKLSLKPLVIIGGGGHASVLVDILREQQRKILAVISPDDLDSRLVFDGYEHFRHDEDVFQFKPEDVLLVNGVGALPKSSLRHRLTQLYQSRGYHFETVIASSALVSKFAKIETGVQVFPNAIIQAGASIDCHTIVNTGVIVEHDCIIGQFNHLAPRATLCGQVRTALNVYIGAGATVIQNIQLADNVVVGAGAVVTKDVASDQVCYPCRMTLKSSK